MKAETLSLLVIAMALTTSACAERSSDLTAPSASRVVDQMPVEVTAQTEPVATRLAAEIAAVDLGGSARLVFLDLGDGQVGVVERASTHRPFRSVALRERWNATALEIYLAVVPDGTTVPDALLRDHRLQMAREGKDGADARRLSSAPSAAADLNDPGAGVYACDALGWDWKDDWKAAFVGITKYREADYRHQQSGTYTFYPGAAVYYGTNTNSITYLGACNGDAYHTLVMEVDRRISGAWTKIYEFTIGSYEKYTFYSGIPASYRGRTHSDGPNNVEHYGIGAAWTLSPGFVMGSD
jgi:hypothetical protein